MADRSRWLWRWRSSPLRRCSYAVEAWVLLALVPATAAAAFLMGCAVAGDAHAHLAQQRTQRHPVAAVLMEKVPGWSGLAGSPLARVQWTASDGAVRTTLAKVPGSLERGAAITVWNDRHGELVPAPPSPATARAESALAGAAAAAGVGLLSLAGWAAAERMTDRRRAERWGREWAEVGPRWDRRTA